MPLPISASSPSSRRPDAIACTAFRLELSCRATASRSRRYSITGSRTLGLRLSAGLTFDATRVGIVSQNSACCSNTSCSPMNSGRRVSADEGRSSFTQVGAGKYGLNSHKKTARLSPRRRSSQSRDGLASGATRGLPVLLDKEVRLVGVAFLGRVVAAAIANRAGGDVVVAAVNASRRSRDSDVSRRGATLSKGGRSNRADAQDNSSNSRSDTGVHGTIHLGLRGLRRMAAGRDLFSDLDLGPSQPDRRAVWHSTPRQSL